MAALFLTSSSSVSHECLSVVLAVYDTRLSWVRFGGRGWGWTVGRGGGWDLCWTGNIKMSLFFEQLLAHRQATVEARNTPDRWGSERGFLTEQSVRRRAKRKSQRSVGPALARISVRLGETASLSEIYLGRKSEWDFARDHESLLLIHPSVLLSFFLRSIGPSRPGGPSSSSFGVSGVFGPGSLVYLVGRTLTSTALNSSTHAVCKLSETVR